MARRQSKEQKQTVKRVMHEFKHGELESGGRGRKVKNPKRAIAIALSEAGASNKQSPRKNAERLRKTKAKERKGETAEARKEGKQAQDRTMKSATARSKGGGRGASRPETTAKSRAPKSSGTGPGRADESKSALYEKAKRRGIPGRSRMSKDELQRALRD